MSFSVIDRNKILEDERTNRLKKIALIERENTEMLPFFMEKQAKLFPQAVQLSQIPTLGEVLTEETQKNAMNEDILLQRGEAKLNQIASKPIVQYILDRLEIGDLSYLVNQWNGIEKKLRDEYSTKGLDKDILISIIKDGSSKMLQPTDPTTSITSRGQVRQKQKEEELKQIEKQAKDRELQMQKEKKDLDKLANKNQKNREAEELKQAKSQVAQAQQAQLFARYSTTTDDPFKYDPSSDKLDPNFLKAYNTEILKAQSDLSNLSRAQVGIQLNFFETTFPNKMSNFTGRLTDKQKVLKFVERLIFDEIYEKQLAQPTPKPPAPTPKPNPTPQPQPNPTPQPQPPAPTPQTPVKIPSKYQSLTDNPFTYDPATNVLDTKYAGLLGSQIAKTMQELNKLGAIQLDDLYNAYEAKFPNKMSIATSGLGGLVGDKQKIIALVGRITFDGLYNLQLKEQQFQQLQQPTPKFVPTIPIEDRLKELSKLKKADLIDIYLKETGTNLTGLMRKQQISDQILIHEYGMDEFQKKRTGNGLKYRKIIGRGMETYETPIEVRKKKSENMRKVINGKYIDLNKLNNNIITIRYVSTGALIPTVKVQSISRDVRGIVEDIINDKFEKRLYEKLDMNEKRLIKRIVSALNIDIDLHDNSEDEFVKQFNIVLGQWRAGNNNTIIKRKLREYIYEANEAGMIPKREMHKLIFELANSD